MACYLILRICEEEDYRTAYLESSALKFGGETEYYMM